MPTLYPRVQKMIPRAGRQRGDSGDGDETNGWGEVGKILPVISPHFRQLYSPAAAKPGGVVKIRPGLGPPRPPHLVLTPRPAPRRPPHPTHHVAALGLAPCPTTTEAGSRSTCRRHGVDRLGFHPVSGRFPCSSTFFPRFRGVRDRTVANIVDCLMARQAGNGPETRGKRCRRDVDAARSRRGRFRRSPVRASGEARKPIFDDSMTRRFAGRNAKWSDHFARGCCHHLSMSAAPSRSPPLSRFHLSHLPSRRRPSSVGRACIVASRRSWRLGLPSRWGVAFLPSFLGGVGVDRGDQHSQAVVRGRGPWAWR